MYKYIIILALSAVSTVCANAQGIRGVVMGDDHSPVAYATITLLEAGDSAFVAGVVGNDDGSFLIDARPSNRLLKVSGVGYTTAIVPATDSMTVLLRLAEQSLREVTVTGTRPTFRMTQGVLVSNIEGTAFSKLGMATDVLQQLPMMSSDGISVLGRGTPLVYINNKRMKSWDELERITSDMIKEVRIDMNPGAKYGSDVRAVLFITTVKPVGEGLGGRVVMQEKISSCWNTTGWLNLNYRKRGLDIFLSGSLNTLSNSHYQRKDIYNFRYNGEDVNANYEGDGYNTRKNGFVSMGFNDQITPRQSIGATYTFTRLFSGNSTQNYRNRVVTDSGISEFNTGTHNFTSNGNHNVGLYYENNFSDRLSLSIDGTYVHYSNYNKQTVIDTQADSSSTLVPVSNSNSDMGAVKAMLTSSLAVGKLEYGFEATYTRYRQIYNVENDDYNGVLVSSDNESRQSAANVFLNYSRSFGKLYTQVGIKYEYADYNYYVGDSRIDGSSKTYSHVLPSLSVSYGLNRGSLMLSYNIYTSKPSYSQLDEGLQYISSFRYNRGNSTLKPTYNHNISLMASYGDFQFTCDYNYLRDAMVMWFDIMETTLAVLSTESNHSYSSVYTSLSYSPTFFGIWKPSWNIWMTKQWLTYNGMDYNRPQCGMQWKNMVTLPGDWTIVANADGNMRGNANTYMALSSMRVSVEVRKAMKNCWIKVGAMDIFNSKEKGYSQYANVYTSHYVNNYNPTFYVTISYSFNPSQSKYKGKAAGQSEINRL